MNSSHPHTAAWTGLVPFEDTALHVVDSGGTGIPVIYLNGSYADKSHWKRVITELGDQWRHITYDERARGGSKLSSDYSYAASMRDLTAVLAARGIDRAVLVGWSYGATLAASWVAENPDRVIGVVAVDAAVPYGITGPEAEERIRKLFHRMRFIIPITARLGMGARMSSTEHADINIELGQVSAGLAPVLERITRPVRYVLATGKSLGAQEQEMEDMRASLDPVLAVNPNLKVSAKVPSNHSKILRKDFRAVAQAVREVAALDAPAPDAAA
jgi:pimeloyl-ACP methyl ester carboxylesterase